MNSVWSLDKIYKGLDDPNFIKDFESLDDVINRANKIAEDYPNNSEKDNLVSSLKVMMEVSSLLQKLFIYPGLRQSANTKDVECASYLGRLQEKATKLTKSDVAFKKYVAGIKDLDSVIKTDPLLIEHEYLLKTTAEDYRYVLNENVEEAITKFNISGGSAWGDLQQYLTSSLEVDYNGDKTTLSSIRNLAYDPDPKVRKAAYEAEIASYDKIKDSIAFSLNSIKLQVLSESKLRGFESPLAETLHKARMKKETLDALLSAMEDYMPKFREYLKIKGEVLGHKNGLPWYDLFAPMGSNDKKYTIEEAKDYLVNLFKGFAPDLADMVQSAFDNEWIDFYPREGKVGGAFCAGVQSIKESRILTNFDGSFSDIVTLAHELGHAYHNLNTQDNSVLNNDYSMPVAETASTFNENIIMNAAIDEATDKGIKLALVESQLQDVTQIICDIYSRFLFEKSVFENRPESFMFPDMLCDLMLDAQKKAYGDGLDNECLHKYMWICKGHYYSSGLSFYNFPYAFGGLFARGLYAKYKEEGEAFLPKYRKLLNATTVMSVEDVAKLADIDLTKKDFWAKGLESFGKQVDIFKELVK